MYKALIIDDETPVRQVITTLAQWQEAGVDQVFEAVEGRNALEIMREFRPEVVFLDMHMPNMNGVEFLKAAGSEFPKTKYIVVSGYEDFEYTKQAINSRVLDYLLKPVVESELNQVLMRAVRELEEERKRDMESLRVRIDKNAAMPLVREKIISRIMENEDRLTVTAEQRRMMGIPEASTCFGVIVFSILNLDRVCRDIFNRDVHAAFFAFTNVIDELASQWCSGFSFKDGRSRNEIVFAVITGPADSRKFEAALPLRVMEMVMKLEELFGVYGIAGIGEMGLKIDALNKSYRTAVEILHGINILQCSDRVFNKPNAEEKCRRISLMDKKEILIYAFESGRVEYARSIIGQYFENIRQQGFWSRDDLYRTAMEFLLIIENITEQLGIPSGKDILVECRRKNLAGAFTKLEEFSEYVLEVVEQLFGSVRFNMKASEKTNLYEIKDYIDKNFSLEIPLSYFSNRYYLSKEYLSKQFREEFGYGIHEYILKVRMEKAGEMICDPSVKIQSVSSYLGYKDNNYFSRAFKAYYGVSPSEYRDRR